MMCCKRNSYRRLIRNLAFSVLRDDNGISTAAYNHLRKLLMVSYSTDILNAIDATDGRFYIPSMEDNSIEQS